MAAATMAAQSTTAPPPSTIKLPEIASSLWADKYRGANVEDLDPPPALSAYPTDPIGAALLSAYERDYTHLTVLDPHTKALLGYLSIPRLRAQLDARQLSDGDPVEKAMVRFQRKGRRYKLITMHTPLEELEAFFAGADNGGQPQDFAVVTDPARRFVLGVATREDLEEFVRRRPGVDGGERGA